MPPNASHLPERAAQNQDSFRELNETIEPSNAAHVWFEPSMPDWVCECAKSSCSESVKLTVAEYEAVRADPTHFLVAPSEEHVLPEVERVVERHETYWVVEKIGRAAELSEELDDRTAG
jgi:hypothetical protein